jgi:hypothetical protein
MKESLSYLCIGPRKTATTWVSDNLQFQTEFWIPPIQELNYLVDGFERFKFNDPDPRLEVRKGLRDYVKSVIRNNSYSRKKEYEFNKLVKNLIKEPKSITETYSRISTICKGKILGDISPSYASLDKNKISEVGNTFKNIKIFMILRDPISRFWSTYNMYMNKNIYINNNTDKIENIKKFLNEPRHKNQLFNTDIYNRWTKYSGKEVKIFYFEDIRANPRKIFLEILSYIGGNKYKRIPFPYNINRKSHHKKSVMSNEEKLFLCDYFKDDYIASMDIFAGHSKSWYKKWYE